MRISILVLSVFFCSSLHVAENDAAKSDKKEKWIQLFNGKDLKDWKIKIRGYELNGTDFPNGNGQPRPGFGQDASLEEVFAAWGPFAAQYGTYELSGSEITYTQLVGKNPGGMLPENATFSRNFRVEGNTLETRGGDPTAVYRYERVR